MAIAAGVDLDPPAEAVAEYEAAADGTDSATPDAVFVVQEMGGAARSSKSGLMTQGFHTAKAILSVTPADEHSLLGVPLDADGAGGRPSQTDHEPHTSIL